MHLIREVWRYFSVLVIDLHSETDELGRHHGSRTRETRATHAWPGGTHPWKTLFTIQKEVLNFKMLLPKLLGDSIVLHTSISVLKLGCCPCLIRWGWHWSWSCLGAMIKHGNINGLVQDCSISSVLARASKNSFLPPYFLIGLWRDVRISLLQLNIIYEGQ